MKSAPWRIRKQWFHPWNCAFGTYIVMRHYKTTQEFQKFGQIAPCKSGFQNIAEDSECSTQALLAFHSERNLGNVSDKSQVMLKNQSKPRQAKSQRWLAGSAPIPIVGNHQGTSSWSHKWHGGAIRYLPWPSWCSRIPTDDIPPLSWNSSESESVIFNKLQPFIETQDPFPVVLLIPNSSILMIPFMAEAKFPCRFSMEKLPCSHESRLLNFSPPGLLRRLDTRFHARLCLSGPRNRNAQKVAMLTGCKWIANIQWFEKAFVLIHFWFYILWGCKENCHFATVVNHTSILMRRRLPNIPVLHLLEWAISSDCSFPIMKYSTILICYPVLVSSFVGRCLDTPAQHLRGQ